MNFIQYQQIILDIIGNAQPVAPYDDPAYLNYVKLNNSRQQRWLKTGILNQDLVAAVKSLNHKQNWTVITEPWCGDAAHTVPFIHRIASTNPLINVDYQLRDTEPFLIEHFLTNGAKSIPKLIIEDKQHNRVVVWGPRPIGCQHLFEQLQQGHIEHDQQKIALQKWYNEDEGKSFQKELLSIMNGLGA